MWGYIGDCLVAIINWLIGSLPIALVVSVVWIRITRRYARLSTIKFQEYESRLSEQMQEYESMLDEQFKLLLEKEKLNTQQTKALQDLYYEIHHRGPRPAMASALGLCGLYWPDSKDLGENLILLSKPNHHKYAALAIKQKDRLDDYMLRIETICRTLHESAVAPSKKFEHLQ